MLKPIIWTPEKLAGLSPKELGNLRENALRRSDTATVAACDDLLLTQRKSKPAVGSGKSPLAGSGTVAGFHFVCSGDTNVTFNKDETFWSGYWNVAKEHPPRSLEAGCYVALHESKTRPSYRQGKVLNYKVAADPQDKAAKPRIEFLVQPTSESYDWVGAGAGEKGYAWADPERPGT